MIAPPDAQFGLRTSTVVDAAFSNFKAHDWRELGVLMRRYDVVDKHPRLLRALGWGDPDYREHALTVIMDLIEPNPDENLKEIEKYISDKYPESGRENISTAKSHSRPITHPVSLMCPKSPLI